MKATCKITNWVNLNLYLEVPLRQMLPTRTKRTINHHFTCSLWIIFDDSSTRHRYCCVFKSFHPGERFQKFAFSSKTIHRFFVQTGHENGTKCSVFKWKRIRVNGAWDAGSKYWPICVFLLLYVDLIFWKLNLRVMSAFSLCTFNFAL